MGSINSDDAPHTCCAEAEGWGADERGHERALDHRPGAILGEQDGLEGLSAHDCRHYWATYWVRKVDVLRLQEAGGWNSLAMPRRYVEESKIANDGMV